MQRRYFVNKGPSSQGCGFSSSHAWMWELDFKESWAQKNWCFLTVVLEKTLESPLNCKVIQTIHPKGNQSWVFIGGTDVEAEAPTFWPPDEIADSFEKTLMLGKIEGRRRRGWQTMRWLSGITYSMDMSLGELRVGDGQGCLACCSSWCAESDTTEGLNWTDWIIEKARHLQKSIYFCFIDYVKSIDCVEHNKLWESLQEMGLPDHLTCLLRNLDTGEEATVRTGYGTIDWLHNGKGVFQGCILLPCLFNL